MCYELVKGKLNYHKEGRLVKRIKREVQCSAVSVYSEVEIS